MHLSEGRDTDKAIKLSWSKENPLSNLSRYLLKNLPPPSLGVWSCLEFGLPSLYPEPRVCLGAQPFTRLHSQLAKRWTRWLFQNYVGKFQVKLFGTLLIFLAENKQKGMEYSPAKKSMHVFVWPVQFFDPTLGLPLLSPKIDTAFRCDLSLLFALAVEGISWLSPRKKGTIIRQPSGDQGDYSCSSETCQDHQKLNSFAPFPSFTAYFTNSTSQIIIHPKNMQSTERLASFFLFWILQLAKLDLISLSS